MIFGGIPYFLGMLDHELTLSENAGRLLGEGAPLRGARILQLAFQEQRELPENGSSVHRKTNRTHGK